ncbi:DUF4352 domain-containing protein [Streptomyces beihaiensis]|uniref:DUF4352 domain-containing protein n=1 Tax=Streptomyces beihaiensis TaxID=2984495 RepID=A0ABT3TSX8_9ACTN|nr:hypothetical protein [Streptomyces beihaiensis]MCX3060149.1 DUF4352 domain-containing protein [Streptomyces beihaiensis]
MRYFRRHHGAGVILGACVLVGAVAGSTSSSALVAPAGPSVRGGWEAAKAAPGKHEAKWGQAHRYKDGLTVTVDKPRKFEPTQFAVGHTVGNQAVKWRITVKNGTKKTFDATLVMVNVKAGKDGDQAEQVFDDPINGMYEGTVTPGRSVSAEFAFDIPKGHLGQVDVEVQPGFQYGGAHWEGSVK